MARVRALFAVPTDAEASSAEHLVVTAPGKALLVAANVGAQRTALQLGGASTMAVGTTPGTVAAGDDSRFAGGGAPTGNAGGSLGGTYPNPTVLKINATEGALTLGSVADGQTLKRVGSTIVGAWVALAYATSPMNEIDAPGSMLGTYTTTGGTVA